MTLVNDGFPRITSEGLEILKEGLNGDFSRWIDNIGNHPKMIPDDMVNCIVICANPEKRHFMVKMWFGQIPPVYDYLSIAPYIHFDTVKISEDNKTAHLFQKDGPFNWFGAMLLVDDYATDTRHRRTIYSVKSSRYDDLEDDDPTEITNETKTTQTKTATLDAWGII